MSDFPAPESTFYVAETFTLRGNSRLTEFAAGPFEHPDHARQARDWIRKTEPARCVHCVEVVNYESGAA